MDQDELNRLRAEHQELLRLRGEVAALRKEAAGLQPPPPPKPRAGANANEEARDVTKEAAKTAAMARMSYATAWATAFLTYASKNDGLMPKTLADAEKYYPAQWASTMSAFDPGKFEIVYGGSLNEVPDPGRTVILREKQAFANPQQPGWVRTYLFADGHTELHSSPDGNFEEWESRLVIRPGR